MTKKRLVIITALILLFTYTGGWVMRKLFTNPESDNISIEKLSEKIPFPENPQKSEHEWQWNRVVQAYPEGEILLLERFSDKAYNLVMLEQNNWKVLGEFKYNLEYDPIMPRQNSPIVYQPGYSFTPVESSEIVHTLYLKRDVYSMAVVPDSPNVFYAIDQARSIIKSVDSGRTWITLHDRVPEDNKSMKSNWVLQSDQIYPFTENEILLINHLGQMYISNDGGLTWVKISQTLDVGEKVLVDPNQPGALYLYRGLDQRRLLYGFPMKDSWVELQGFLPQELKKYSTRLRLYVGHKANVLFSSVYLEGAYGGDNLIYLYRSLDGGKTWTSLGLKSLQKIFKDKLSNLIYFIVPLPPDDNTIYIFTEYRDVYKLDIKEQT